MSIERVLFPTRFRELSFNSLEALLVLKKAGMKEIILCHVISREDVGFVPFGGYLQEEEDKLMAEARIRFEDWQRSISEKGIESKIVIRVGDIVPQILHVAEEEKVDMIVLGKKKEEHPFAGSKTFEIMTRSRIPALVSKYMVHYMIGTESHEKINEKIFERPMLVTNWSEPSERALDFMISLDGIINKALIFHDIDVNISKKHDKEELHQIEKQSSEKLDAFCEKLKTAGIDAESHLGAGEVVSEIIRISRDRQATMIIIGTSGKGWLNELIKGSVSHQVAKDSELPTLLVP